MERVKFLEVNITCEAYSKSRLCPKEAGKSQAWRGTVAEPLQGHRQESPYKLCNCVLCHLLSRPAPGGEDGSVYRGDGAATSRWHVRQLTEKENQQHPTHPGHSLFKLLPSGRWYNGLRKASPPPSCGLPRPDK